MGRPFSPRLLPLLSVVLLGTLLTLLGTPPKHAQVPERPPPAVVSVALTGSNAAAIAAWPVARPSATGNRARHTSPLDPRPLPVVAPAVRAPAQVTVVAPVAPTQAPTGPTARPSAARTTVAAPTKAALPSPRPPKTAQAPASPAPRPITTAAERYGWGKPVRVDDFSTDLSQWSLYDGPGHAAQGRRSPEAASVTNGVLTITGDSAGTTAGMTWLPGQLFGRWEARVKAPAGDPSYDALLLLWPDADDFPLGGEVDFMELTDPTRQSANLYVHHGADNEQVHAVLPVDATQWHNWAIEWTPQSMSAFVDGVKWWSTTDTSILPPGPMHLAVQLDWFPNEGAPVRPTRMMVDWVRCYPL